MQYDTPWHAMGKRIDPAATIEEAAVESGLNWNLVPRRMLIETAPGQAVVAEGKRAWVRDTDNRVITYSGDQWRPMQPVQVLEFMRDYMAAGSITLEAAGSVGNGEMVWGIGRLPGEYEAGSRGDALRGYVLITSPNKIGTTISVKTLVMRLVCLNGMVAGQEEAHYRQNHLRDFDAVAARERLAATSEHMARTERNAKMLNAIRISAEEAVANVLWPTFQPDDAPISVAGAAEALASPEGLPQRIAAIINSMRTAPGQREIEGTAWGVLNAVTHWATHTSSARQEVRFREQIGGTVSRKVAEVQRRLLELA